MMVAGHLREFAKKKEKKMLYTNKELDKMSWEEVDNYKKRGFWNYYSKFCGDTKYKDWNAKFEEFHGSSYYTEKERIEKYWHERREKEGLVTPLEKEFRKEYESIQKQIDEKLNAASDLIDEACNISEEYGIPFRGVSHIVQNYTPEEGKYRELLKEEEDLRDEFEIYFNEYGGWEHSDVC